MPDPSAGNETGSPKRDHLAGLSAFGISSHIAVDVASLDAMPGRIEIIESKTDARSPREETRYRWRCSCGADTSGRTHLPSKF